MKQIILSVLFIVLQFTYSGDAPANSLQINSSEINSILKPEEAFSNGYQSYQSGDWQAAVYFFEQVPPSYILSDYAIYYKADALLNFNRPYEALLAFDKVAKEYKDSILAPLAVLKTGDIFSSVGNSQTAAKYFNGFIDAFPNHIEIPQTLYKLAINLEGVGKSDDAQRILKQLWVEHPTNKYTDLAVQPILTNDESYNRLQNLFKAGRYKTIIKEAAGLKQERFIMLAAKSFYRTKDYYEALENFKIILDNRGDDNLRAEAMFWFGKTHANLKNRESALSAYREFLNIYSKSRYADEVIYRTAILLKEQGYMASAIEMLEKLAREFPSSQFKDEGIWQVAWMNYEKGEYKKALKYLKSLEKKSDDRLKKRAVYWQGKILLKLDSKNKAIDVFKKLLDRKHDKTVISDILPSYYEMLAKKALDDLGINIAPLKEKVIESTQTPVNPAFSENLHLKKAQELLSINLKEQAYTEIESLENDASLDDIVHAGILYKNGGNINRAYNISRNILQRANLSSVANHLWSIISLAYPLGYQTIVDKASLNSQLDPYLVYAVMLHESGFDNMAVSRAGALGVMQIMPKTGKTVVEKSYRNNFKKEDLFLPQINITLGTNYLKELIEEFGSNVVLAIAAYNAGPSAVKSWLKRYDNIVADEFVENIPYQETRRYVELVLGTCEAYKYIYNNAPHAPRLESSIF